jgi:regulatory protein
VSPRIARIEDAGPGRKARRLVFDDGSEPRITSAVVVKQLRLLEDTDIRFDALNEALAQVEPDLAKERAIQLLGYRERSTSELRTGLVDSGYGPALAATVVERLQELGLADDERFAGMWVRSRAASGIGARRIARELVEKGVAEDVIDAAMRETCPSTGQLDRAIAALRGRVATDRKERNKLVRRLVSRGYELSIALRAVQSTSEGAECDSVD